jgi:hypothetical protein
MLGHLTGSAASPYKGQSRSEYNANWTASEFGLIPALLFKPILKLRTACCIVISVSFLVAFKILHRRKKVG